MTNIIKGTLIAELPILQNIIFSLYKILSYLEINYLGSWRVKSEWCWINLIFKILHFISWLRFVLFEVHKFLVGPKLNCKVLKEHIDFTLWFTLVLISARTFIKVNVDLSVVHIKSIIKHIKLTRVWKVRTNNSLLEPGIIKINVNLFIPEIILCAPFYWNSSSCGIEVNVQVKTLFFKINVSVWEYIFNWRVHFNIFSLNPTKE